MILYLTYNDQPSGVYWSQVTDVVAHLNTLGRGEVRLLALVSVRGYRTSRELIRAHSPTAIVLPMVPRMKRWRYNTAIVAWVCRRARPTGLIARGVHATAMGRRLRERGLIQRVCFDGRGAYAAEWEEYRIIDDDAIIAQFRPLERDAVLRSDMRIAVSQSLVDHWCDRYGYKGDAHVVIPCTLGGDHLHVSTSGHAVRQQLGVSDQDVLLVYSGSVAGWQSFGSMRVLLDGMLATDPRIKVLFLSRATPQTDALAEAFPGRIHQRWVPADQVADLLHAADHGLLLREESITNQVSSPTKFAEYLAAGLPVLISPGIGDFSALVEEEGLGHVVRPDGSMPVLARPSLMERERLVNFARRHFLKAAHDASYTRVMDALVH